MSDPPSSARWRASVAAGAVLAAVAVVVVVVVDDEPDSEASLGAPRSVLATDEAEAAAASTVERFETLWNHHAREDLDDLAGSDPRALQWMRSVTATMAVVDVAAVDLRYVAAVDNSSDEVFRAEVEVSWRPGPESGLARTWTTETVVTFGFAAADRVAIVSSGEPGDRYVPVWLTAGTFSDAGGGPGRLLTAREEIGPMLAADVRRAVQTVQGVVGAPAHRLVVVVPKNVRELNQIVGSRSGQLDQIAAIATTVDGSGAQDAPVHVVVNPSVYRQLGRTASQVVLTHEGTHVMTGATAVPMALWVAEGFADYVALAEVDVPLSTSAGQMLALVRRSGPPDALPSDADFEARAHGLGRTYEAAWTVFRLLGQRYGREAVVSFYDRVLSGTPPARAVRAEFGLTVRSLTAQWRRYLVRLASG